MLSTIGTGFAAGVLGTEAVATRGTESQYVLVQGDTCVPVRPMRRQLPVKTFYDYQLPEEYISDANGASVGDTAPYASAGTLDFQRRQTSIVFLYQGPKGLSLVFVHGSSGDSGRGSATFEITGLPEDGDWVVKDDLYRDPNSGEQENYDRWHVDGTDHRIDWTWGGGGADGGVFRGLGDDFEVVIDPAFNEDAALYDEYYNGTVTDWQFLSGFPDDPDRVSLDMSEPIRITTGSCERSGGGQEKKRGNESEGGEKEEGKESEGGKEEEQSEKERKKEEEQGSYTVCHRPPGNPDNARTIHVGSESALREHLDHGDSRGPCSEDG
ncbi:hypothetical protein [Halorussus sp. MSC15.2]|uniref:hypothetical protein n=1 Tax=Halorussus sp. MSC15.2 TaxID=2283638 RepID=UPI0013D6C621|nr:hypothetical protein [Halorussus sp. MSC15.2]NEU56552.1 hypothetical protein [Halorussus sp. MSC15.2]